MAHNMQFYGIYLASSESLLQMDLTVLSSAYNSQPTNTLLTWQPQLSFLSSRI